MNVTGRQCSICSAEADWVRMRMPNSQQMNYLCHRHYQALQQRNPILAAYDDAVAATSPMQMQQMPVME
jgi:hypothetical protein